MTAAACRLPWAGRWIEGQGARSLSDDFYSIGPAAPSVDELEVSPCVVTDLAAAAASDGAAAPSSSGPKVAQTSPAQCLNVQ